MTTATYDDVQTIANILEELADRTEMCAPRDDTSGLIEATTRVILNRLAHDINRGVRTKRPPDRILRQLERLLDAFRTSPPVSESEIAAELLLVKQISMFMRGADTLEQDLS